MRTNTHNFMNFFSLAFFAALKQQRWWMSGCPLSLFYSTRLNGPFRDSSEIDGETNPKNKTEALFFSAVFLRLWTARRLINTQYFTHSKTSRKDLFLFTSCSRSELTDLEADVGLEGNQCNQSLLFSLTYFSMSFFSLIWHSFLMWGQTYDSL